MLFAVVFSTQKRREIWRSSRTPRSVQSRELIARLSVLALTLQFPTPMTPKQLAHTHGLVLSPVFTVQSQPWALFPFKLLALTRQFKQAIEMDFSVAKTQGALSLI